MAIASVAGSDTALTITATTAALTMATAPPMAMDRVLGSALVAATTVISTVAGTITGRLLSDRKKASSEEELSCKSRELQCAR